MLKDNTLYLGDDDAFPVASIVTFTGAFVNGAADAKKILITTMASGNLPELQSHWRIEDAWMRALKEHAQGYLVYCRTAVSGCDEILILGGSATGAQFAVKFYDDSGAETPFIPGHYYALGFKANYDSATTSAFDIVMNDGATGADMRYVVTQPETPEISLASTAGTWQGASFVFRIPDDQDGALDDDGNLILSRFHYRNHVLIKNTGATGAGNLYLTDFRLYDLSLLLMNVLPKQGVTVTDGAGMSYAEGSDYTIEYGALPIKTGVRTGKDMAVYWQETQAFKKNVFNADGSLKGSTTKIFWTGATRPEKVYVTYSSLFPSNQGATCCSLQFRADMSLDEHYTEYLYPMIEADLGFYAATKLPRWAEVISVSEIRRMRTGTSPGQQSLSNSAYLGNFFGKMGDKLAEERAKAGDNSVLKPIVWHDMLTEIHNSDPYYQYHFGGNLGGTADALESLPGATVNVWYYRDCFSDMLALAKDFMDRGFNVIAGAGYYGGTDDEKERRNNEDWAMLLASDPEHIVGVVAWEWPIGTPQSDYDVYFAHLGSLFGSSWASWGLLHYFAINAPEMSAGDWSAGLSALNAGEGNDCKGYSFVPENAVESNRRGYERAELTFAESWVSAPVALRPEWDDELGLIFAAKSDTDGAIAPTVTVAFYDVAGLLVATVSENQAYLRGDSADTTLATTYDSYEIAGINVPVPAASVIVTITPSGTGTTSLDDVRVLQKTDAAGWP